MKKIILAADHAGFEMKEYIKWHLAKKKYPLHDVGADAFDPIDDYPQYMHQAAKEVARACDSVGILFGGSGQGEAIVANRHEGIRAIVLNMPEKDVIVLGREHNDANVLSVGARFLTDRQARDLIDLFLKTPFPGDDRHLRRIQKIETSHRVGGDV